MLGRKRDTGMEMNAMDQAAGALLALGALNWGLVGLTNFDAFRAACGKVTDATPLLVEARAIKTDQEIERMRLANELAALAMDYTREHIQVVVQGVSPKNWGIAGEQQG